MYNQRMNHNDIVVSILLAEPFQNWDQWRAMEDSRASLIIDPRDLNGSLETVRNLFDESVIVHMTRVGQDLLHDMIAGEIRATSGYRLCLRRWEELPYFTRKTELVDDERLTATDGERVGLRGWDEVAYFTQKSKLVEDEELTDLFFRHPWFFYLLFTDPAL